MNARNIKKLFGNGFLLATQRKEAKICQIKSNIVLKLFTCLMIPARLHCLARCIGKLCGKHIGSVLR